MGIAFYIKLFIQFQANYMEYSRVQCKYVNMQSTVLYYFKKIKQRLYITLEIKNLLWNFNLKWFLCEGCLKWKFQLDRFLNFRFLYVGFNCIWSLKGYRRETCSCISSYLPKSVWETTNAKILVLGPHLCIRIWKLATIGLLWICRSVWQETWNTLLAIIPRVLWWPETILVLLQRSY